MRFISSSDLLAVWERGAYLHPIDRGLTALRLAFPNVTYDTLADWPLGRRNATLVRIYCALVGTQISGWVACPRCGEKLEFQIDAKILLEQQTGPRMEQVSINGLLFRLPSSRDLAAITGESEAAVAARKLLERCCMSEARGFELWTDIDVEEIGEAMAKADTLTETLLSFACPQCGVQWSESLEIEQFLWSEIEVRAKVLLRDVHTLASAYGWAERDILALSDARRAAYLEMVQ